MRDFSGKWANNGRLPARVKIFPTVPRDSGTDLAYNQKYGNSSPNTQRYIRSTTAVFGSSVSTTLCLEQRPTMGAPVAGLGTRGPTPTEESPCQAPATFSGSSRLATGTESDWRAAGAHGYRWAAAAHDTSDTI